MAIGDTNKYSVWISTDPNGGSDTFVQLCSDASISYDLNYAYGVTGLLGQSTGRAVFVDKSGGAVGNISVSGVRVNPSTSTEYKYPTSSTNLSNADFIEKMKKMIESTQMLHNAFTLRIYNIDAKNETTYKTYKEFYVYIKDMDFSFDWKNISEMDVSFTLIRRNKKRGFGSE